MTYLNRPDLGWTFPFRPHVLITVRRHNEAQIILSEQVEQISRLVYCPVDVHEQLVILCLRILNQGWARKIKFPKVFNYINDQFS